MVALADDPALLVVALGIPLHIAAVVLLALYWVVRLAVRHAARDAAQSTPGDSALPGPPTT